METPQGEALSSKASPHGIILASGLASRLGLLSNQGKWSVRYKAAPVLVSQLLLMARAGVQDVTVTCRPEHAHSMRRLIDVANFSLLLEVSVCIQDDAPGPGIAFLRALQSAPRDRPVVLLLADTIVESISEMGGESWIEVAPPDRFRRWCEVVADDSAQVVELADRDLGGDGAGTVAIGLYYFHDRSSLSELSSAEEARGAFREISAVIDAYRLRTRVSARRADGWLDVGDSPSIVDATRSRHLTRADNQIAVDGFGVLRKKGTGPQFRSEAAFMRAMPEQSRILFPRVTHVASDDSEYSVEYLDYRTLAELYLYEPGTLSLWGSTIDDLLRQLRIALWDSTTLSDVDVAARCRIVYQEKLISRFEEFLQQCALREWALTPELELNGRLILAGRPAVAQLRSILDPVCSTPTPATIHGDLNFSNILCAPAAGIFRLIDPRGSFGGQGASGDARYDAAKLRHSYHGMYDAIIHGLYSYRRVANGSYELAVGPNRSSAVIAIDTALENAGFDLAALRAIECSLFLSMLPLHADDPQRQFVCYLRGLELLADIGDQSMTARSSGNVVG